MSQFEIYKKNQGKYTRTITLVSVLAIALIGAYQLSDRLYVLQRALPGYGTYLRFGIPVAIWVGLALVMAWLVNRPGTADFLIATEGEMKKVSWSSKKEIIGSTKVVIVTTLIVAVLLFAVDLAFLFVFRALGVRA